MAAFAGKKTLDRFFPRSFSFLLRAAGSACATGLFQVSRCRGYVLEDREGGLGMQRGCVLSQRMLGFFVIVPSFILFSFSMYETSLLQSAWLP